MLTVLELKWYEWLVDRKQFNDVFFRQVLTSSILDWERGHLTLLAGPGRRRNEHNMKKARAKSVKLHLFKVKYANLWRSSRRLVVVIAHTLLTRGYVSLLFTGWWKTTSTPNRKPFSSSALDESALCDSFNYSFCCFLPTALSISRDEAIKQVIKSVREFVGPVAFFKTAIIVPSLPKVTRSKIRKRNYHTRERPTLPVAKIPKAVSAVLCSLSAP